MKTKSRRWSALALPGLGLLLALAVPAFADDISLTGALDPADPNEVLLISFSLSAAQTVNMQSYGFGGSAKTASGKNAAGVAIAPGGFDTYFSLFNGLGTGAAFLASNDDGSCPPGDDTVACRDSTLNGILAAGSYTLAVSVFDNFSFAENVGGGTLGDGFIGLGNYFNLDQFADTTSDYAVDLAATDPAALTLIDVRAVHDIPSISNVPEPAGAFLLATALIALGSIRKLRRRAAGRRELR